MTHDQTVLCARCGFANAPGDQFCGSCGTFLEWEGSAAGVAMDPSAPASAAAGVTGLAPTVSPGSVGTPSAASAGAPASRPAPPTSRPADPSGEGLLRCPSCGIANAASRTFCQTCGAKLTPAARVAARSHDEIAAAVAAVPGARAVQPGPPVPSLPPGADAHRVAPKAGRSLPPWILVVVVLGVLAGVAAVVGSTMLKGGGPASAVSAVPSLGGPAASASAAAASLGPSASARASTVAGPTPAPLAGTPLKLTGAAASSIAAGDTTRYGPQNAIDGSLKTSWQEGSPTEKGEWIEVSFDPSTVTGVIVRNGFQASTALYKGNLRLKDVQISVDGGAPLAVRLKDTTSAQKIVLTPVAGATHLRITIVTTYPSVKTSVSGTPFADAAVSEVGVLGVKAP